MNPTRPTVALMLALTSVGVAGCPFWGNCDTEFVDETRVGTFPLNDDGTVDSYEGDVDPATKAGCETLCVEMSANSNIASIGSCEAKEQEEPSGSEETDEPEDTDQPEETDEPEEVPRTVEITCVVSGTDYCIGGRHSAALSAVAQGRGPTPVAAWLAREASAEGGSVHAFQRLAEELKANGAPAELVERALEASADEVRHRNMVGRLAQGHGGVPAFAERTEGTVRSLFDVAKENAVQGCVHETYAAARVGWQAAHATDPRARAVFAVLATDEARHAELAADVHAWACAQLPADQARTVEDARQKAWRELSQNVGASLDSPELGLPNAETAVAIARALAANLGAAVT